MAEVPAPVIIQCSGCPRHFDDPSDLAPARVGRELLRFCRRCYVTALGVDNKVSFEQAQELELS